MMCVEDALEAIGVEVEKVAGDCCLKKLFLDEVFGGEAVADVVGIGGGCSSGGGGKISDQFGTNK